MHDRRRIDHLIIAVKDLLSIQFPVVLCLYHFGKRIYPKCDQILCQFLNICNIPLKQSRRNLQCIGDTVIYLIRQVSHILDLRRGFFRCLPAFGLVVKPFKQRQYCIGRFEIGCKLFVHQFCVDIVKGPGRAIRLHPISPRGGIRVNHHNPALAAGFIKFLHC